MPMVSFLPLHGEHGEVVTLLCVTHEVCHSLRHPFDECTGLLGGGLHHLNNPFLTKQPVPGILRLIESVGIEEECAARICPALQ